MFNVQYIYHTLYLCNEYKWLNIMYMYTFLSITQHLLFFIISPEHQENIKDMAKYYQVNIIVFSQQTGEKGFFSQQTGEKGFFSQQTGEKGFLVSKQGRRGFHKTIKFVF